MRKRMDLDKKKKKNYRSIIALREANHYNLMFIIILKEKKGSVWFFVQYLLFFWIDFSM